MPKFPISVPGIVFLSNAIAIVEDIRYMDVLDFNIKLMGLIIVSSL